MWPSKGSINSGLPVGLKSLPDKSEVRFTNNLRRVGFRRGAFFHNTGRLVPFQTYAIFTVSQSLNLNHLQQALLFTMSPW